MADLKELLGEELFNKVTETLKGKGKEGKDLSLLVNDGNFIPKEKFNEVNEAKKQLEADIKTRDEQLKDLGEKAKGNEDLTKQINALTEANTKAKSDYEQKLKDITINSAIEKVLLKESAKFPDLLINKFDKSKLVIDGDNVVGLDEQVTGLKTTYKDLFGETKIVGGQPNNSGGKPDTDPDKTEIDKFRSAMGL